MELSTHFEELLEELSSFEKKLQKAIDTIKVRKLCWAEIKEGRKREVVKGIEADFSIERSICDVLSNLGYERCGPCDICYTPKGIVITVKCLGGDHVLTLEDFIKMVKEALELENKARETVKNELQRLLREIQIM